MYFDKIEDNLCSKSKHRAEHNISLVQLRRRQEKSQADPGKGEKS